MKISRTLTADAIDPKRGMTLDELEAFIADAKKDGLSGNVPLIVRVSWSGKIKHAEVKG